MIIKAGHIAQKQQSVFFLPFMYLYVYKNIHDLASGHCHLAQLFLKKPSVDNPDHLTMSSEFRMNSCSVEGDDIEGDDLGLCAQATVIHWQARESNGTMNVI